MDFTLADDLPKLMPLWHDLTIQPIIRNYSMKRFASDKLPDYGGSGVDISSKENELECVIQKHAIDQVHFGAHVCAFPFLPANKDPLMIDPCLSHLQSEKKNFDDFCLKLDSLRRTMKKNGCEKYKKEIRSSHKFVKKMCSTGKFRKTLVPKMIVEMARKFPESVKFPTVNLDYAGGCLSSSQAINENPILLHPTGWKLDKLALTPLEETCEGNMAFKPIESAKNTTKLKDGYIQQINSAISGYCYVKQEKYCHFIDFTDPSKPSFSECSIKPNVKSIVASLYIPVELLSIHENGNIFLNDIETRGTLWGTDASSCADQCRIDTPLVCDFGSHPKSVLYLSNKDMYGLDLRLQKNTRSTLFSCNHPSCYTDETLLAMKGLVGNPFQHLISSTYHLFVCDERYPKKPVLIWNHLLKGSPLYCDITSYDTNPDSSDAVVLLGTQESQELVSFAVRSRHSHAQTISLSPPLFLSSPTDCVESLRLHCLNVDNNVIKRLSYPLVGVCAVPHNNKPAFTAFQITSLGDLFYQDFEKMSDYKTERTYRVDMGCVLTPPDRILPHLSEWNEDSNKDVEQDNTSSTCSLNRLNIDLKEILRTPEKVSNWCDLCKSINKSCDKVMVSSDKCPSCGLEKLKSEKLQEGFSELRLLIGPMLETPELYTFDTSYLSQFSDKYSKKILEPWVSLDVEIGTPTHDYSSDFSLMSPASSRSSSNPPTPAKAVEVSDQIEFSENLTSQPSSQSLFLDETFLDISMYSQEYAGEIIPPSQEVRAKIGETLRPPKKSKVLYNSMNTSSAGF